MPPGEQGISKQTSPLSPISPQTHTQKSDITLAAGENSLVSIDITLHPVARRQESQH